MANNHIATGAFFKDPPISDGKTHPVGHIAIEVLGVKLNLAVWPAETSTKGTKYSPVTGDYNLKEIRRLVDVTPVFGAEKMVQPAPAAEVAVEANVAADTDLPF